MNTGPVFSHRVAYADTDAGGVMYHGRYFDLAERSRNEALASRQARFSGIQARHDLVFVVNRVQAQFLRPAVLDDALSVSSRVGRCTAARVVWHTEVARGPDLLARLVIHTAGVRLSARELCLIPPEVLALFESLAAPSSQELS